MKRLQNPAALRSNRLSFDKNVKMFVEVEDLFL